MNPPQTPSEFPLASLLTEQRQLEPNLPTLVLASELLSDVTQKLKDLRDDLHSKSKLELDENLLYLDISKEVLRVQSLLIFLSQGRPLLRDKREEILVNLGSKGHSETQRLEEGQKMSQHLEIIEQYKKQLHSLKKQNKELKRIAKLYLASEERRKRSPEKIKELEAAPEGEKTVERKRTKIERKPQTSEKKFIRTTVPERFEIPEFHKAPQERPRKMLARRQLFGSMEKSNGWTNNANVKLRLESEIRGLDDEIEHLTQKINQYL